MLSSERLNYWPAFADMTFMLAISSLVVCAALAVALDASEAELRRERDAIARVECGLATPVVESIRRCLEDGGISVQQRGCSLSIEGRILFRFGDAALSAEEGLRAGRVADCIIVGARQVASADARSGLDSVSIEGHADRCGYRNLQGAMALSQERARAVYDRVLDKVLADRSMGGGERLGILARVSMRAMGPYRPRKGSACDCAETAASQEACRADRRVEIVVQGRLGDVAPDWEPPSALPRRRAPTPQPPEESP